MTMIAPPVVIGEWEVEDFPGIDSNGDYGLVTKMRPRRSGRGGWRPYDRAVILAAEALRLGRNDPEQDVWWTGRDKITVAIDDMNDNWRRFCARLLIDAAAAMHWSKRRREIISSHLAFVDCAEEKGWCVPDSEYHLTFEQIRDIVRREQATGAHLTWMRSSPLFQRMIRDLDWTHIGVTGTSLDREAPPA